MNHLITNSSEIEKEEMEQIKRELSSKYGFNFDKELIPLIVEIMETKQLVSSNLHNAISIMEETRDKVNNSQKTFQFASPRAAFAHGFGAWGLPLLAAIFALSLGWYLYLTFQFKAEVSAAWKNMEKNALLKKEAIDPNNLLLYFTLTPITDLKLAEAGKHYYYDAACKCIKVPINFQPKTNKP